MTTGSDTERATPRDPGRMGSVSLGSYAYCVTTGLGIGAFCGEPLAWTIAGAVIGIPVSGWLVPAAVRERRG